jgi:hypothetical protein
MKNLGLFCLLFLFLGFASCKKTSDVDAGKLEAEKTISTRCYQALYEKDTINLQINTLKSGKISGDMVMRMENMPPKIGEIKGEFQGDTLFADYSFIEGVNENKMFKNPIAILKKGDEFILGNGKIETYLGSTYFIKGVPIDFENVKYKFKTIDCTVIKK